MTVPATVRLIDAAMLAGLSGEARASARRRKNRNFHPDDAYPAHRLLNAIEPESYIPPHRHLDAGKDETLLVVAGEAGLLIFADDGRVADSVLLRPGGTAFGADIAHGTWHTVLSLVPGTVIFEAKAGPFRPLAADELAPWAPREHDPAAAAYLATLAARFRPR